MNEHPTEMQCSTQSGNILRCQTVKHVFIGPHDLEGGFAQCEAVQMQAVYLGLQSWVLFIGYFYIGHFLTLYLSFKK